MTIQISKLTAASIRVIGVSRPTSHCGWRWSLTHQNENTTQCIETQADGSKLYLVENGFLVTKRQLIDGEFFLAPDASMFDAINEMEKRFGDAPCHSIVS